jgi:hypothetical protein
MKKSDIEEGMIVHFLHTEGEATTPARVVR